MNVESLSTFDDIQNQRVRTWNRCAMWFRAGQKGGLASANLYLKGLDEQGLQQVAAMLNDIKTRGYTTVRREVTASI